MNPEIVVDEPQEVDPEDKPAAVEEAEVVIPDDPIVILDDPLISTDDAVIIPEDIEVIPEGDITGDEVEEDEDDRPKTLSDLGVEVDVDENGNKKPKQVILTKDMMKRGLSHVTRVCGSSQYAYCCFDGQSLDLTNIDLLKDYPHLRAVDLSKNRIRDCKVFSSTKHLMVLVVNDNLIEGFHAIPDLPFLQTVGVSGNKLQKLEGMPTNSYTYVQLSFNKIRSLQGLTEKTCPVVTILELRGNHLTSLKGISLPTLEQLFVADNNLTSLQGLQDCPQLKLLHARDNKISRLENFPCLKALEYVNLRTNKLEEFAEIKFLGASPNIKVLVCMNNPICELDNYREELIGVNPNLQRLDKEPLTEQELALAKQMLSGPDNEVDTISEAKEEPVSEIPSENIVKKEPAADKDRTLKGLDLKKK